MGEPLRPAIEGWLLRLVFRQLQVGVPRQWSPLLQLARLALIVTALALVRRLSGDDPRADAAVPVRAKSGRRRTGRQRSPGGRPADQRELRGVRVTASVSRRYQDRRPTGPGALARP